MLLILLGGLEGLSYCVVIRRVVVVVVVVVMAVLVWYGDELLKNETLVSLGRVYICIQTKEHSLTINQP